MGAQVIHTLCRTIEPSGARSVAPRGPLLEWDSLSRCMIPVALPCDREPAELLRGDVMFGGPWPFRGDLKELRESDRHERLRLSVGAALGYYDHDRPNFEAPAYEHRRERAGELLLLGPTFGGGFFGSLFGAPPKRQPWQFTSAGRYYDVGFLRTGSSPLTGLGNGGADGSTYDATNAGSTLTYTAGWMGAFDAVTATAQATDLLTCGGAASDWLVHGTSSWTMVWVGDTTDTSTNRTWWSNRATPTSTIQLGASGIYASVVAHPRLNVANGTAICYQSGLSESGGNPSVMGARHDGINSRANYSRRAAGGLQSATTGTYTNSASNSDASAMVLGAGVGGTVPLHGRLAVAIFHQLNSAGYLQSTVDHCRALARI